MFEYGCRNGVEFTLFGRCLQNEFGDFVDVSQTKLQERRWSAWWL